MQSVVKFICLLANSGNRSWTVMIDSKTFIYNVSITTLAINVSFTTLAIIFRHNNAWRWLPEL